MLRTLATLATTVALAAVPTTAFGLSASSSEGRIDGGASKWYHAGADMRVTLNSYKSHPVYASGLKVFDYTIDDVHGRFTGDIYDQGDRVRNGRIGSTGNYADDMDGLKIRVCRNINNLPDSCSSWSGTSRNPVATD